MTYFYEARMTEKHIALMTYSKGRQKDKSLDRMT